MLTLLIATALLADPPKGRQPPPPPKPIAPNGADATPAPANTEHGTFAPANLPGGLNKEVIEQLGRKLLLDAIPRSVEEKKNWGKQVERPALGRKQRRQAESTGQEVPTKLVNHGTWRQYAAVVIEPEKRLGFRLENLRLSMDQTLHFRVIVGLPLFVKAELQQWIHGLRLLGVTAEADAGLEATLDCQVRVQLTSGSGFLPELAIEPKVTNSELRLREFRLRRIGDIGGKVAHELGDEAKKWLDLLIRNQGNKIADKANQAIQRKADKGKIVVSATKLL